MEDSERKMIRLIQKGKNGIVQALFGRFGLIALSFALQLFVIVVVYTWFLNLLPHIFGFVFVFMIFMVIYLINSRMDPTAKITWLIVFALMPVFGAILYCYTKSNIGHRILKENTNAINLSTKNVIEQNQEVKEELNDVSPGSSDLANYISKSGCFPIYSNTSLMYFASGEEKFAELKAQLRSAKKFIFLEYFIISEGIMWGEILSILEQKVKEGVEVRLMYDGTCEYSLLPHDYPKRIEKLGIKCKVFAPLLPIVSTHYNYRDHRKILVIDGHIAFTGGINLADEYINEKKKYGTWKDSAIMLRGEAANSFTLMFLQMWNVSEKKIASKEFQYVYINPSNVRMKGYVVPYGDNPMDNHKVGELVYMDLLNRAHRYVHIMTPYLILDAEMETAIKFAAQRGVEVSIILPGVPDKKIPYALAKTHYMELLEAGVHIYEYQPGFVHAKVFVVDDIEAVVGTINLDYRSLYHHFECAVYMYGTNCISDIEIDFVRTKKECRKVDITNIWDGYQKLKPIGALSKVIAPLL